MYIRQNHTTLHKSFLSLIISSKNYISNPKILAKGPVTVVFVRNVANGF